MGTGPRSSIPVPLPGQRRVRRKKARLVSVALDGPLSPATRWAFESGGLCSQTGTSRPPPPLPQSAGEEPGDLLRASSSSCQSRSVRGGAWPQWGGASALPAPPTDEGREGGAPRVRLGLQEEVHADLGAPPNLCPRSTPFADTPGSGEGGRGPGAAPRTGRDERRLGEAVVTCPHLFIGHICTGGGVWERVPILRDTRACPCPHGARKGAAR